MTNTNYMRPTWTDWMTVVWGWIFHLWEISEFRSIHLVRFIVLSQSWCLISQLRIEHRVFQPTVWQIYYWLLKQISEYYWNHFYRNLSLELEVPLRALTVQSRWRLEALPKHSPVFLYDGRNLCRERDVAVILYNLDRIKPPNRVRVLWLSTRIFFWHPDQKFYNRIWSIRWGAFARIAESPSGISSSSILENSDLHSISSTKGVDRMMVLTVPIFVNWLRFYEISPLFFKLAPIFAKLGPNPECPNQIRSVFLFTFGNGRMLGVSKLVGTDLQE